MGLLVVGGEGKVWPQGTLETPPIGGGGYVPLRSPPLPPSCSDAIFDAIDARRLQYLRSFHLNYIIK